MLDELQGLARVSHYLDLDAKNYIANDPQVLFASILKTISDIDKPTTPQRPPRSEQYLEQWRQYLDGNVSVLDKQALKYLCWESEVIAHPEFCQILVKNKEALSARVIKGLVSTIHQSWQKNAHAEPVTYFTAAEIARYSGSDRTITKWKSDVNMLLGKNAAASFAKNVMLDSLLSMKSAAESWALNEHCKFMRYVAVNAFEQAMSLIEQNKEIEAYVLEVLLGWEGWRTNAQGFNHMICRLILAQEVSIYAEKLCTKILSHPLLGDPRLPANRVKWLSIDSVNPDAKKRFISWLSREDIKFFFDNVLEGRDPHGRRNFWLRYVGSIAASRPFISEATALPLRNNREISFGKLSAGSNKAAFVLNFGEIIAVEFSEVGAVYLYRKDEFNDRIPDMWTMAHIQENRFKDQGLPGNRKIRHNKVSKIVSADWRKKTTQVLAQYGIRP